MGFGNFLTTVFSSCGKHGYTKYEGRIRKGETFKGNDGFKIKTGNDDADIYRKPDDKTSYCVDNGYKAEITTSKTGVTEVNGDKNNIYIRPKSTLKLGDARYNKLFGECDDSGKFLNLPINFNSTNRKICHDFNK